MSYVTLSLCLGMSYVGHAQTTQVQIAGINYPVIFADTNLSFKIRQRIADDLKIVFSPAPSFEELGVGKGGYVTKADIELEMTGFLVPAHSLSTFITDKQSEGIFIVTQNSERSVQLNQVASSNYVHAFTLVDAHSNAVKKAGEFIALMKDPGLLAKPIKELRNLYHATPLTLRTIDGIFTDEMVRGFLQGNVHPHKHPGLSVLHFAKEKRPEIGNAEVLVMYFCVKVELGDEFRLFAFPVLFHKGRWGFGRIQGM